MFPPSCIEALTGDLAPLPAADAEYDYLDSLSRRVAPDQQKAYELLGNPGRSKEAPTAGISPLRGAVSSGPRRPYTHHRTGSAIVMASPRQVAVPLPVSAARLPNGSLGGQAAIRTAFGPTIFSSGFSAAVVGSGEPHPDGSFAGGNDCGVIGEKFSAPSGISMAEQIMSAGHAPADGNGLEDNMPSESARSVARTLEHLGLDDGPESTASARETDVIVDDAKGGMGAMTGIRTIDQSHGRSQSLSLAYSSNPNALLGPSSISALPNSVTSTTSAAHAPIVGSQMLRLPGTRASYLTHRPRAISLGFIETPLDMLGTRHYSVDVSPAKSCGLEVQLERPAGLTPAVGQLATLSSHYTHDRSVSVADDLGHPVGTLYGVRRQLFAPAAADDGLGLTVVNNNGGELYSFQEDRNAETAAYLPNSHTVQRQDLATLAGIQAQRQQQQQQAAAAAAAAVAAAAAYQHHQHGHSVSGGAEEQRIHPQIPTRSLWIGTIDPSLTVSELLSYFSPFGPIESVRMLPEKECAFVNYARIEDAICARDEMQGARVGNCIVRVGFGRAEGLEQATAAAAAAAAAAALGGGVGTQPTRALWVGNISPNTSPAILATIFAPFGPIDSCRVLSHKNCGFVNFESIEDAVRARRAMQGQEIGGMPVRIGFAKVPPTGAAAGSNSVSPGHADISPTRGRHRHVLSNIRLGNLQDGTTADGTSPSRERHSNFGPAGSDNIAVTMVSPWAVWGNIGEDDPEDESDQEIIAKATNLLLEATKFEEQGEDNVVIPQIKPRLRDEVLHFAYAPTVPPIPEPKPHRKVDQPRLRDLRKRLDLPQVTAKEIETAFNECYDDCVELCSDYIGNTVVQKFAERCHDALKLRLVKKVAPHLAAIGVHKNGTWAVQKIIDSARTEEELMEITSALRQYTPPLLLDQFGNYVVQCCLRLGSKYNQFVFNSMYVRCWDIAQGRFGARAIRTCLESQYATRKQQKLVAIGIVENALQLATNPNGSILLTWLLDTSQLSGRYLLVAPRFANHLAQLCVHKLASLTVLKVVNQRQEPEARVLILQRLFGASSNSCTVLDEVLADQVHGVALIQKCLASQVMEDAEQVAIAARVRDVLLRSQAQLLPGYKRLFEEVEAILSNSARTAAAAGLVGYLPSAAGQAPTLQPWQKPEVASCQFRTDTNCVSYF